MDLGGGGEVAAKLVVHIGGRSGELRVTFLMMCKVRAILRKLIRFHPTKLRFYCIVER